MRKTPFLPASLLTPLTIAFVSFLSFLPSHSINIDASNGLILGYLFSFYLTVPHKLHPSPRLQLHFLASDPRYSSHLSSQAPELYVLDIWKATELMWNKCLPWNHCLSCIPFLGMFHSGVAQVKTAEPPHSPLSTSSPIFIQFHPTVSPFSFYTTALFSFPFLILRYN